MFKNADIFGSMVKSSYPMIWAPKEFKFLEFTFFNESLIQRVLFIDINERIFTFDYEIKNYEETGKTKTYEAELIFKRPVEN